MRAEAPSRATLEIHSFRVVFALERRLHRIDRWRLPLPYGLPVRALAYAAAVLLLIVAASRLPGIGDLVRVLPAPVRFVLLPGIAAFTLDRARVDGRPAHKFLIALLRHRLGARHLSGFRRTPPAGHEARIQSELAFVPDLSAGYYRPSRIKGPARLRLAYPVEGLRQGRRLVLRQSDRAPLRRAKLLTLPQGAEVEFR